MSGVRLPDWTTLERFSYGDSPALADELLALVLAGKKTATCWAVREGQLTQVGKRMVACDGQGRPRAVIETVSLTQRRFHEVDADWARLEGEGNGSLADWRDAHRTYFTRNGGFARDMLLWCEVFRVVKAL